MSNKPKILLLTDVPPCKNYTGGIMISQMIRLLLEEKLEVSCFGIINENLKPEYSEDILNDIEYISTKRPYEKIDNTNTLKQYNKQYNDVKKQLFRYIKKNKFTKIWCPLQGEVLGKLLRDIKKQFNIPYIVQIWDPIEWWMDYNEFDSKRYNNTLELFDYVIKESSCCITTSKAMSKEYNKRYGIKCIEVMPAVDKRYNLDYKQDKDKFIIALSGQLYAKDEFDALLDALDSINWKYNNKEIYFEHYGIWNKDYLDKEKHKKYLDRIILKGFMPQKDLLDNLAKVNLLYCPYFFSQDKSLKTVSELSFPSKLITYLSLKVPTLLHAPSYSSPYLFLEKTNSCFLLDTLNKQDIVKTLKEIIDKKDYEELLSNASKIFDKNFTMEIMKDNFLYALNIEYDKTKKLNILEVNNIDIFGRRFNGYDLMEEINHNTPNRAKQIVTLKHSDNKNVVMYFPYGEQSYFEYQLLENEREVMGVHSQLSLTSDILENSDYFKNADVIHYHLIHNTKLNLYQMIELASIKPTVITFHDQWAYTGRCVVSEDCEKWKDGCKNCEHLNTLFELNQDNCHSLWELKKLVNENIDVDVIVASQFMYDMLKTSPVTKSLKHVHLIPFGLDLNKFKCSITREEAKKKLGIPRDNLVLFFRELKDGKGTEYIIEALKELKTDKKITLLTCSATGLLEDLKDKYNIIELGNIKDDKVILSYTACDMFLMPSRGESFGFMAIEAMACERPVVVFNNTSLPYITFAPDCGVLVENKNSHKLMEAIKMLIDNKEERERRGALGRKLVEENYNVDTYNKRIFEVYKEAYERQKNKKEIIIDTDNINYKLKDVDKLDEKLSYIYKQIFPNNQIPNFLHHDGNNYDKKYIIDYANIDVQKLIRVFNQEMYKEFGKLEIHIEEYFTFKKAVKYAKTDRSRLAHMIYNSVKNHKVAYKLTKVAYRGAKGVKKVVTYPIKVLKK